MSAEKTGDDLFVFGPDGIPTGVKTSQQVPLSPEELHDVVVAATAYKMPEAIALMDLLEGENIPSIQRGGIIHLGPAAPTEILVPRKLLARAQQCIANFRTQSPAPPERHWEYSQRDTVMERLKRSLHTKEDLEPTPEEAAEHSGESSALIQAAVSTPVREFERVPLEIPEATPRKASPLQKAQRGTGIAMIFTGGLIMLLEYLVHQLQTPMSIVALVLVLVGLGLCLNSAR